MARKAFSLSVSFFLSLALNRKQESPPWHVFTCFAGPTCREGHKPKARQQPTPRHRGHHRRGPSRSSLAPRHVSLRPPPEDDPPSGWKSSSSFPGIGSPTLVMKNSWCHHDGLKMELLSLPRWASLTRLAKKKARRELAGKAETSRERRKEKKKSVSARLYCSSTNTYHNTAVLLHWLKSWERRPQKQREGATKKREKFVKSWECILPKEVIGPTHTHEKAPTSCSLSVHFFSRGVKLVLRTWTAASRTIGAYRVRLHVVDSLGFEFVCRMMSRQKVPWL